MSLRSGWCGIDRALTDPCHLRCTSQGCPCVCHVAPVAEDVPEPEPEPVEISEPAVVSLADAIEVFVLAAEQVNVAALEIGKGLSPEDALRRLHRLREGLTHAQVIDASLVRHAYLHGEHGEVRLDDLPPAKVTRGRDRTKWDERGVAQAVIDQRMSERGFEVIEDPWTVAEWLLEVFGIGYCRVTPLRALGLEPKAFCEERPGNLAVQFVG